MVAAQRRDCRRGVHSGEDDSAITAKVRSALIGDPQTKARDISVKTYRGVVELSGFVDSNSERDAATADAQSVQGVKAVDNALHLKPPAQ